MVDELRFKVIPEIDGSKTEASARAAGAKAGKSFTKGLSTQLDAKSAFKGFLAFSAVSSAISAVGAAARQSVTDLRDFSRGVAEVNSILPANQKLTRQSEQALISFSSQFATGPATQAKAFYNIVSAGVKGTANQLRTLQIANKAAVAGLVSIDDSAKLLVSSVNAYSKSGLTAAEASDALFVAVREGQTTFGELSGFLGNVTGLAATAGLKFSELTGSIAAFTKQGLKTDIAVTGLRQVLTSLIKPTKEAVDEAQRLGINFSTAGLKAKGFANFIKEIADKTKGSSSSIAKLFGNVRALAPILTTVNGNFNEFRRILGETANSAGATAAAFKIISDNLDFKLSQRGQEFRNFFLDITRAATRTFSKLLGEGLPTIESLRTSFVFFGRVINTAVIFPLSKIGNVIKAAFGVAKVAIQSIVVIWGTLAEGIARVAEFFGKSSELTQGLIDFGQTSREVLGEFADDVGKTVKGSFDNTIYDATGSFLTDLESTTLAAKAIIEENQPDISPPGGDDGGGGPSAPMEQITTLQTLFSELSAGFSATEKEIKDKSVKISKAAIFVGQNIKRGIGQGIGAGFAAFGAALVKGENALGAFAKAFLATLGQMMIQQGAAFILQGLGFSVIPGLQGNGSSLIATGAALAALGGALTAVGGAGGAGAGGGSENAGGFGSFDSGSQFQTDQEEEREAPGTNVGVTINGDVLDSDETGLRIVTLLNEAFDKEGVVFRGAQTV